MEWVEMSIRVICDKNIAGGPAMMYGFETVVPTKRQEAEMEVVELKMYRFSLGANRIDRIKN